MCIIFMHVPKEDDSDYRLILASNRDEYYDRPSQNMAVWSEDPGIIGGRDLQTGCESGTWLALSPLRRRIGVLLNLHSTNKENAKTRGRIVADYVKTDKCAEEYVNSIKNYVKECNNFTFVSVELDLPTKVRTYTNTTDNLTTWTDPYVGFSNSLPDRPYKKVEAGRHKLRDICSRLNKVSFQGQLVEELVGLLKSEEEHLPDPVLESNILQLSNPLSSIFVKIPERRYGTRTHTIVLVTKTGHMDVLELTLQEPIDSNLNNAKWTKSEFQYDI